MNIERMHSPRYFHRRAEELSKLARRAPMPEAKNSHHRQRRHRHIAIPRLCKSGLFAIALAAALPLQTVGSSAETMGLPQVLVVGTKEAPPFAMKDQSGKWTGISIDLWNRVSNQLGLQYRFEETDTVQSLIDGLNEGRYDVAVAAITVTAERERKVDFTTPYFHTGTGVAVQSDRIASWLPVFHSITSYSFLQAIGALLGLALLAGVLIWLFERRSNEGFGGGMIRGLSSGVFWSANAMTQRADASVIPMTLAGRVVAVIWMVVSVIAIAVFTAGITSTLTTKRLHGMVNSAADLSSVRVGVVQGTATEEALMGMRIRYKTVISPQKGFDALKNGSIDAFVYDRPILAWMIRRGGLTADLSEVTFEPQDYAIALRRDSPLRKRINVVLLDTQETDSWKEVLFRYLGRTMN
ncbi:transporter substrate-binding domain-containing protein [Bradyrhizobium sp. STM 3843]|uniref:transporter substrate-binding domain-containing protein n=1 Tax=Bradyrhizobium sp. STM 3843 TaxID=551947 RepID=UPI00030C1AB2|nr:transporter substrate-binding domain-containing protein [Bradyrhizobium sp. STM 3843]